MTPEISTLISVLTLAVTGIGWWVTARHQKQLLEMQINAERRKDTWQQVSVPKINELRELKDWLEDGLRVFQLQKGNSTKQDEVDAWLSKGYRFMNLAERIDWDPSPAEISLGQNVELYFGYLRGLLTFGIEGDKYKLLNESAFGWAKDDILPAAIKRIEELIERTASTNNG